VLLVCDVLFGAMLAVFWRALVLVCVRWCVVLCVVLCVAGRV